MVEVLKEELLGFIARAHRHTYAAPKEIRQQHRCEVPLLPGHKDYEYVEGVWRYHDSYAGSICAPGSEVVLLNDEPIWRMSYQGRLARHNAVANPIFTTEFIEKDVFPFLKQALMEFEDKTPFRGRDRFGDDTWFRYHFRMNGDYDYFTAKEFVTFKGIEVFHQDVMGELIK